MQVQTPACNAGLALHNTSFFQTRLRDVGRTTVAWRDGGPGRITQQLDIRPPHRFASSRRV